MCKNIAIKFDIFDGKLMATRENGRKEGGNGMGGSKEERKGRVGGFIILHIGGMHFSRKIMLEILLMSVKITSNV